jgi:hypothetical protein
MSPFRNGENKLPVLYSACGNKGACLQYPITIYHTISLRDQMSFGPVDNYARTYDTRWF